MPMLECQQCQHDVICHYTILEKFQHLWLDLDQRALFGRQWVEPKLAPLGPRVECPVEQQCELLARQAQSEPITQPPVVVQFDDIWLTIQVPQDTIKPDKRQRQRHPWTGQRVVVLVVLGFWQMRDLGLADRQE